VTMDLKEPGNLLLVLGMTGLDLGGSLWAEVYQSTGGRVPRVDPKLGLRIFKALHQAISRGLIRSCHDLSEGGLAVALAEMALAGGLGAQVSLSDVPRADDAGCDFVLLFSESTTRFVLEVPIESFAELAGLFDGLPLGRLGEVAAQHEGEGIASARLTVRGLAGSVVIDASVATLKAAWQRPLHWS
jgi:phosphoribosylformylglycinamidine (FGAM) synthase-like enzyme